jgi:hypothetical protein
MIEEFGQFIDFAWRVVLFWWWLPAFFILAERFDFYWKWWRTEIWFNTIWNPVLLEVRIPKVMPKPIKAMEAVMVALHGALFNAPDWWESYNTGEPQTSLKFEITSINGQIHFYIRCHADYRHAVEAAVYSQYPECEIEAVPDYSKQVPLDIPNKKWDLFGWDYKFEKKQAQFPIPTYEKYVEQGVEEEEIVDPFTSLMEAMAKLKNGEQLWIQIHASPRYIWLDDGKKFVKGGEHLRDVLAKRIEKQAELEPLWKELLNFIVEGPSEEKEKVQELFPAEMRLTAGEREVIEAVEHKISKPFFACYIRNIYLGERELWYKPNWRLLLNYFNHFTSPDLNSLWVWSKTLTRVKFSPLPFINALADRRTYLKKRHLLRMYRERLNYYSPWGVKEGDEGSAIWLNVEELATLFHFPSHIVSPTPGIQRTEAKETVAPSNLPI